MTFIKPAAAMLFATFLAACGGGSGKSSNVQTASTNNAVAANITLQSSANLVSPGGSVTLTWSSSNADSCSASGGWSGSKSTAGSESVGPLQADTSFTLSCSGPGGGGVRQLTVQVDTGSGVSVNLTANPTQVPVNGTSTLNWASANAASCTASGGWSGAQPLSGSFTTGALTQDTNYQITCNGGGSAVSMVMVEVLDKILRWQAPTENVDGSPLTDLAGYNVYWGTQTRDYSPATGGGNVTINSPNTTQWDANLAPGSYYFALTALDSDGNKSAYSNEVLKAIP